MRQINWPPRPGDRAPRVNNVIFFTCKGYEKAQAELV